MELKALYNRIPKLLSKYRYVILILLIGIGLMLLPSGSGKSETSDSIPAETAQQTQSLSDQLEQILSSIDGAGQVRVLLTQGEGEETIYQTDSDITNSDNENTTRIDTVTVTDSQRDQTGLVRQIIPPSYRGAIVVCQGADSSMVRLAIVEAVSKVTGLGVDRISVLKMK